MPDEITLRVDDSSGASLIVGDVGSYTFKADEYVPVMPIAHEYEGQYVVTPTGTQQILETGGYILTDDVTIEAAPLESKSVTVNAAGSSVVAPSTGYYGISAVDLTVPQGKISMQRPSMDNAYGEVRSRANVTAGYVTSGTYGDTSVTLRAAANIQGAQTITPGTTNQTIAANTWLTGAQTISGDQNLSAGNIKSGVSIFNITGTYTGGGGGSVQFDTKTASGGSTYPVSLQFTGMKGEPKAFVCRLNAQVSSSGSTTYYYIVDVSAFGTTTHGNCFRIGSTRRVENITSGYSWSYSGTTLTITSSAASRSASPGAFHSGSYELLYCY